MNDDEGILSFEDAAKIGSMIADMADRVKVGHKCLPGTQAKWRFEMDGTEYEVIVSVAS